MRIAELSTQELRRSKGELESHHQVLLLELESTIKQAEALSPGHPLPDILPSTLRYTLSQLSSFLTSSVKLHIWKLSFRLWNTCVDLSNARSSSLEIIASLRHVAADMLFLALDVSGVPSPQIKSALFYHRTGLVWHDLKKLDLASACFERAMDIVSNLDIANISDDTERKLLFDLNLARSRTAWEVSDQSLSVTLLNRAKSLLFGSADHYKSLATQFLAFGQGMVSRDEHNDAFKLMNEALELCEKGFSVARRREDTMELKRLRAKTLRFISALHLQKGEYESVLKCVKVLRDGCNSGGEHASLPVLAMKAWLGLGNYSEAEKELRGMVVTKEIPEGVWVSAIEAYFQAAGTAGAETTKGVFLGLLDRCHVSAKAALRVTYKVLGDSDGADQGSRIRAKVVAELVSDERIVALFAAEAASNERKTMHVVLWNQAAGYFQFKDFVTSAEMFEKSMLYIPQDIENRALRAKSFRVLCLCYLGLSQLDRAQEYIDEAGKLEPNVACAFLKFKICLQKKDAEGAINQIETMTTCLDFTLDYISLAAHEAIACRALSVAIAALSVFLKFYALGKPMPITEVVVLRTLVTIITQDSGNEPEALEFIRRAHNQACKIGPDCFFGEGEVGKREKHWFAATSWNIGTRSGKEKKYELCVECFRLASEFYSFMADEGVMVCKSMILSASAMISAENQNKTVMTDTEVKQAADLVSRAGKILKEISASIDDELLFLFTVNVFDIEGRLKNSESQRLVVKSYASSRACNPQNLLRIGIAASQGGRSNHEVASFALNECLSSMLLSSSPDYQTVALVIRKIIGVASVHKSDADDDDGLYNLYKQAYKIMVGLKEGEYPREEGNWLAMTAWNRAALPLRLGQTEMAKKWMNVAIELARKADRTDAYKAFMEEFVASLENKLLVQTS